MSSPNKGNIPVRVQKGRAELQAPEPRQLIIKAPSPSRWCQAWQGTVAAASGEEKIIQADASK